MRREKGARAVVAIALGTWLAASAHSPVAHAADGQGSSEPARSSGPELARTRILLRLDGALSEQEERALSTLLAAELAASGVSASLERSESPLPAWIDQARLSPDVLLVVALDAREPQSLQLYVVDAARGRALVRRLPGGVESNAAVVEAIVSIVVSAAAALREGLEVASRPLSEVVPQTAPGGGDAPSSEARARAASAGAAQASGSPSPSAGAATADSVATLEAPSAGAVGFGGGLGAAVSSFTEGHAPSFGVVPSLVARPTRALGVHAAAAFFWPSDFVTSLGEFSLGRTRLDLTLSYSWDFAALSIEPELGVALELLRREATRAAASVQSTDAASFVRVGPLGRLRLRYALSRLLGLELAANLAYFPRQIRFVAQEEASRELAAPVLLSVGAELGLYILSWKE